MKVLFLDVDGVLNHPHKSHEISDEKVSRLKRIIDQTQAKIILISTWRNSVSLVKELFAVFERNGVSADCVYKIPYNREIYDSATGERVSELKDWFILHKDKYSVLPPEVFAKDDIVKRFLKTERISHWVAIDDDDYCKSLGKNFIRTDWMDALSEEIALRAISILNERTIVQRR